MALNHLPRTFCWSRIGSETTEDLATLVLRKEWERRLGGGRFLWGIGQSPGASAQMAALRSGSLLALFSPAAGRARAAERRRENTVVWNAWIDASGQVRQLPAHAFVTSRATWPSGRAREQHYALVCASPTALSVGSSLRVSAARLRNVATGKAPGASRATVIVDRLEPAVEAAGKSYPIVLAVELEAPWVVRLVQPTLVKARDLAAIRAAARAGDFEAYAALTQHVRSQCRSSNEQARGVTRDLFDMPLAESAIAVRHGGARLGPRSGAQMTMWT